MCDATGATWLKRGAAALLLAALGGCVHREIEIMTRPPGARVEFDGRVLEGGSPQRFPFYWYGDHEIIVEKPGYIRKRLIVHIVPPWYEQFPIDFFTELLWPGWLCDIRSYPIALDKMLPMDDVPDDEKAAMKEGLLERAGQFRRMARERLGLPSPEEEEAAAAAKAKAAAEAKPKPKPAGAPGQPTTPKPENK